MPTQPEWWAWEPTVSPGVFDYSGSTQSQANEIQIYRSPQPRCSLFAADSQWIGRVHPLGLLAGLRDHDCEMVTGPSVFTRLPGTGLCRGASVATAEGVDHCGQHSVLVGAAGAPRRNCPAF